MRVIVTGGAGFIGSHIVDHLIGRGDTVLVVDDLSTGSAEHVPDAADFVRTDIGDAALPGLAVRYAAEAIVHAAAQASVGASMADPIRDATTNIVGGINVIQSAAESGCRRFVYVTTGGALYGVPEQLPMTEAHPIRPLSAYGLSKFALEGYLRVLLGERTTCAVLRLANVYGPRQNPLGEAGVVAAFGAQMVRGETVTIHDDGEQTRDFVYAGDVARATVLALDATAPLTVNISTGTAISINTLFRLMAEATGYERMPVYGPRRAGDVRHSALDNRLARERLNWEPATCLADGLSDTLTWIRDSLS